MAQIDRFQFTTESRAGYDWWSLQPIRQVQPPKTGDDAWTKNTVDDFIVKKLSNAGLTPNSLASPRSQIRRLYFDLIGLPPSPKVVAQFEADPSDETYAKIVNELLKSKRYGERWGRHWLDVVRFGESNGFERNGARTNFWHYRDWVINALNNDMPYDEFVRQQLIGDLLDRGQQGAAAVGFLVAGVHNTVVGGSERMKKLALQDELEEVIGVVGQTFLGLTINCGRCHDHKFDPIKQAEYYSMIASISGMSHGERIVRNTEDAKQLAELSRQVRVESEKLTVIDSKARTAILAARKDGTIVAPRPLEAVARWEFDSDMNDSLGGLHGQAIGPAKLEKGALVVGANSYVKTSLITKPLAAKTLEAWVQVDTLDQGGGAAISIQTPKGVIFDAIVFAERQRRQWMAGSNGFARTDTFSASEENVADKRPVHMAIVYQEDGTITGYREGRAYGKSIRKSDLQKYSAKNAEIIFGLRHTPAGSNKHLRGRIFRAALYDRALTPDEIAHSASTSFDFVSEKQIMAFLPEDQRKARGAISTKLKGLQSDHAKLNERTNRKMYTMNPRNPAEIRFLERGDIEKEGDVVNPGGVASVKGVNASFDLDSKASDADRRRKLAEWITSPSNPLFARVIVNRLWQYHFGTGIVVTPSDFGFNGGQPSHPDLLDYLAGKLKTNGYRLKSLHREIVTSAAYRQATTNNVVAAKKDSDNRLLWRMQPRRLEAEAVRDAMLSVSGQLNLQMGGPGYIDVAIIPNNGTTYYEAKDVTGPEYFRRTIYRFTPRGGRSALLDTFDCPDPATTAPRRAITTTPLQALSLLNNAFVLRMSNKFATHIEADAKGDINKQVDRAWQLSLARAPNETEKALSVELVEEHGLASLCRGLFNTNEFVLVD